MSNRAKNSTRTTVALAMATLLAALWVGLGLTAQDASGVAATQLGKTAGTPKPLCPENCQAVGTVTGFQVSAGGEQSPFRIPADGHLVAWSVDLANLEPDQIESFNSAERFRGESAARIGVLKSKRKARYKLTKQSPTVDLVRHFGTRPVFTLGKPLKVKEGQRVAITLPTWAPLYVNELETENQWIASRSPDECGDEEILNAKPQDKKGSIRSYGCRFPGERLLYWAYFLPN